MYLYLPELLSLNLYMTLLSFVMLLLNYVFSPIQQAQNIDFSISEFHEKKTLKIYSLRDVSRHVYEFMEVQTEAIAKWGLKKATNRFISKLNIQDLRATLISLRCFKYERIL